MKFFFIYEFYYNNYNNLYANIIKSFFNKKFVKFNNKKNKNNILKRLKKWENNLIKKMNLFTSFLKIIIINKIIKLLKIKSYKNCE